MRERARATPPWVIAVLLAATYVVVAPFSGDLAAQTYRADLFGAHGFVVWDNAWYGGHHVPAYSLLSPPLGAWLGPRLTGALAAVAAALVFEQVLRRAYGPTPRVRLGAQWFALGIAGGIFTGRVTFTLGAAIALGAVWCAQRGWRSAALALAVLTALASPVDAAFLALIAAGWGVTTSTRGPAVALLTGAVLTGGILAVLFPEGGSEPFVPSAFWPGLAALVAILVVLPREERALRSTTALYALGAVASFAIDTPVGGNVTRLAALAAGPVLAAVPRMPRRAVAVLAVPLLYWQLVAPVRDVVTATGDPSVHAGYYAGLERELATLPGPFRLEVPFTRAHWDTTYLAEHTWVLARGWERQVDRDVNAVFYSGTLTPARYRAWLADHAVAYVALPDVTLDPSATAEARILRSPPAFVRPVWHDAHWRLFAVRPRPPLATGGARMTALGTQSFSLAVPRAGTFVARIRFTPYWRAAGACVAPAPGGWTAVRARAPGVVRVRIAFALGRVHAASARC